MPASKTYDQGLRKLANGSPTRRRRNSPSSASNIPISDWAQKGLLMTTYAQYQAADYDRRRDVGRALSSSSIRTRPRPPTPLYLQANVLLQPDPRYFARPGRRGQGARAFQDLVKKYPEVRICRRFQVQDPGHRGPARRQGNVGRPLLSQPAQLHCGDQPLPQCAANYQTTRHSEEALYRLTEAYLGLGITDEAQTAAAVLGHNFPDSQWYKDAYGLLKGGGLSPNENQSSWISKLYHSVVPS